MLVFYWDKVGSFVAFKGDLETPQQKAMFEELVGVIGLPEGP